jgi:hypothetical protein
MSCAKALHARVIGAIRRNLFGKLLSALVRIH